MTPTVSLATVQATVARAIGMAPHARGRIERGAALLALGAVETVDAATYSVRSQTTDDVTYTVTSAGCGCVDAGRQPIRCKHQWAVRILLAATIAEQQQREQDARARFSADSVALVFASARRVA